MTKQWDLENSAKARVYYFDGQLISRTQILENVEAVVEHDSLHVEIPMLVRLISVDFLLR